VAAYLNAQIDAGAQAVMVFDSWGGVLADGAFQRFSLHYTQQVVGALQRSKEGQRVPVIVFTKGGGLWLDEIAGIGADVVGLDWTVNLGRARAAVGSRVALQGNLDPNVLRRACLQPRPRHQPVHATRARERAGGGRAPALEDAALRH
jgi:uroporphyrinogen decarboxylase